ncbi:MAG TPA: hypothetical protein VHY58_18240 [Streptosporangiaceae bacterium]|jgi:hypothetical protein|nr:hypothetical protein [Streptosporangiaceae bacterium]
MITGIVIAAIVIGIGTWLRWVSRPAVVSIRYVLDLEHNQAIPTQSQNPAQVGRGRLVAAAAGV